MNADNFCYWLQGMFELTNTKTMSAQQVQIIKNHLQLVFDKQTPFVEVDETEVEDLLDKISKQTEETLEEELRRLMDGIEKDRENPPQPWDVKPYEPYDPSISWPTHPDIVCSVESKKEDMFCSTNSPLNLDVACAVAEEDWYKNGVQK